MPGTSKPFKQMITIQYQTPRRRESGAEACILSVCSDCWSLQLLLQKDFKTHVILAGSDENDHQGVSSLVFMSGMIR